MEKKLTGYESVRLSDPSSITISDLIDQSHKAYVNFVPSLKSPITRKPEFTEPKIGFC
jgi:hypothetical protein